MTVEQNPSRQNIVILHNPLAGRGSGRSVSAIARALAQRGCEVRRIVMAGIADLPAEIADILEARPDVLAVAGGDGTLNKIMPHLAASDLPLAILPLGTANVLATALGIPQKTDALVDYILQGQRREMAFGTANGNCFCCMVSVGFDAAVVGGVSLKLKKLISKGAYGVAALRAFWRHCDRKYTVRADGRSLTAHGAIVSLTPFYAGRFVIAPEASPFAPKFSLVLFKDGGRLSLLRYAFALALGKIVDCRGVEIISAREIEISTDRADASQADGDISHQLPLRLAKAGHIVILTPAP